MATSYDQYLGSLINELNPAAAAQPLLYAPQRAAMENQYNVGRQQLLDTMPRGGQLNSALANLITQRAQSVGGLDASLYSQSLNRALQLGQLTNQANVLASQQRASNWGGLGTGLGILAGLAMGAGKSE